VTLRTPIASTVPHPLGRPGGPGLWHHKGLMLPPYIQNVAHAIMRHGHTKSQAIQLAVGAIKNWAHGHDGRGNRIHPDVQAAAAAALAAFEAARATTKHGLAQEGTMTIDLASPATNMDEAACRAAWAKLGKLPPPLRAKMARQLQARAQALGIELARPLEGGRLEFAGPHGYEHGWVYVGGPGLPNAPWERKSGQVDRLGHVGVQHQLTHRENKGTYVARVTEGERHFPTTVSVLHSGINERGAATATTLVPKRNVANVAEGKQVAEKAITEHVAGTRTARALKAGSRYYGAKREPSIGPSGKPRTPKERFRTGYYDRQAKADGNLKGPVSPNDQHYMAGWRHMERELKLPRTHPNYRGGPRNPVPEQYRGLSRSEAAAILLATPPELRAEARQKAKAAGRTLPGTTSYPTQTRALFDKAVKAVGRGGADHDRIRRYLMRVARQQGWTDGIPPTWASDGSLKTQGAAAA
jgi:hypothetical protein